MAVHPTQILMHNPQALRIEYRLDDQRLICWWSPRAGQSNDCADRNFSNRDDHLQVFDQVVLPGCGLDGFQGCDYDPYHCVLHWSDHDLHIATTADQAAVLVWASRPQAVRFKTERYDEVIAEGADRFAVSHSEVKDDFVFAARLGSGAGSFKHCTVRAPHNSRYALAECAADQVLVIGVGLGDSAIQDAVDRLAATPIADTLAATDAALAPIEAMGAISAPQHPELERLRRCVVRGLHSMIDESGAFRASIKAIYYLIWVRDAGFSFPYQEAAGWSHKLAACTRLLLDNPCTAQGEHCPPGRMFAQLINTTYGKYEEDGAFYVIWMLFTLWTNSGDDSVLTADDLALLREAVAWLEDYIFDAERGLFGGHFADESPTLGARDQGYDYAIGRPDPSPGGCIQHQGQPIVRSYDTYINLLMHSAYTMLAAFHGAEQGQVYSDKAARLWAQLAPFFDVRTDGLPTYGEMLLADGSRAWCPHWGPASTVYVWALSMPCFAPVDDWDAIRRRLLEAMMAKPRMHWINGICSALAAVDPWCGDEAALMEVISKVQEETDRPGPYLPMGGAMPEKFDAPQGNLYHDIRPQGFAMGAWLGAWSSLGLRRLPYGLALRPTTAFERLSNFAWRDATIDFRFTAVSGQPQLQVNGTTISGSLQIPHDSLRSGHNEVAIIDGGSGPLLIRSTVEVLAVDQGSYRIECRGLSEVVFAGTVTATADDIDLQVVHRDGLTIVRCSTWGELTITAS